MPDTQDQQQPDSQSSAEKPAASIDDLVTRLETLESRLSEVNQESAARRIRIKELEEEREAFKQAQLSKLEQEGNYKAIAEERAKKLAELSSYQERANALEEMIRTSNDARIASVPEHMRGLIPTDYAPERLAKWLDDNANVLVRPQAPDLGAGMAGGNGAPVRLNAAQTEMAKRFNMTAEEYAAALRKMGQ